MINTKSQWSIQRSSSWATNYFVLTQPLQASLLYFLYPTLEPLVDDSATTLPQLQFHQCSMSLISHLIPTSSHWSLSIDSIFQVEVKMVKDGNSVSSPCLSSPAIPTDPNKQPPVINFVLLALQHNPVSRMKYPVSSI